MEAILILVGVIMAAIGTGGSIYNGIIKAKNKRKSAWADVETHLKKRYDLVPNLVSTVKGITKHESKTFEKVVQARNSAMGAQGVSQQGKAENVLSETLKSIFALAESYPDLKSNQNFLTLQTNLNQIESDLNMARRYFNGSTQEFNNKVETFPNNIFANIFGFKAEEFFELETPEEANNVTVAF